MSARLELDAALVQGLIKAQFPAWAELPVTPVEVSGWDNHTFRLGRDKSVRLPSAAGYVPQVEKEHRWLSTLAPHLPLPIPAPLARGEPSARYPFPWSVYGWLEGEPASHARIGDLGAFAEALADFLTALGRVDPTGGPPPGLHSAFRGGPLRAYDTETRQVITALTDEIDAEAATAVWEEALDATWRGPPVWFHGDVAAGNLLVQGGRLTAVIDFGCAGVGDPACDLAVAWTLLSGRSREAFRARLGVDAGTWARGRGWALWKALITLEAGRREDAAKAAAARRVLQGILGVNRGER